MRCPACGVEAVDQALFCHRCGERLDATGNEPSRDARAVDQPAPNPADILQQAAVQRGDQPETELWRGGYSPKAMLGAWIISGLISLALLIVGIVWVRDAAYWLLLLAGMFLPWLYHFAVLWFRRMSVRYVLTTQRFIHESGIVRRINSRVELLDIDDITLEQGLWERLAGVGTIRIASHDRTDPELVLPGIENVQQVTAVFDNARLAERRRRGLHVEQI